MTAIQPKLELLSYDLIARILDEAFQLMQKPGIKIQSDEARDLLMMAGATAEGDVVRIPEKAVRKALDTVPGEFYLYDRSGNPKVHYGGNSVHFDPGSSGVHILDPETLEHKTS
jgi:trimethylamine:corrinoid methyltransferase-like protein